MQSVQQNHLDTCALKAVLPVPPQEGAAGAVLPTALGLQVSQTCRCFSLDALCKRSE